jgi:serine/threonine protein kinase
MDPAAFRRLIDLVGDALERPETERLAWLQHECRGDAAMFDEARSLLAEASATSLEGMTARLQARVYSAAAAVMSDHDDAASHAGERVGAYRLVKEIGRGGMGTVYLAERDDETYTARAAIKFVRGRLALPELERRFRAERQILADLNHRNIARLLDGGAAADGTPYLVMEYLEGEPIDMWCEQRSVGVRARIELFLHVCDAVAYAHRAGVIHRDIKPANILVTADGTPRLLDFGIAKLTDAPADSGQTGPLMIMTPMYASPEQVRGDPLSTATDVYSLGVVLYELLAGRAPFDLQGASFSEIERKICYVKPAPPSEATRRDAQRRREVSGALDGIVLRALEKEPGRRHPSVDALSGELRRFLSSPPHGRIAALGHRVRRLARRPLVLAGVGAIASVAAVAVVLPRVWGDAPPPPIGAFQFLAVQEASTSMPVPYRVVAADVNGDGRADLIWNHASLASNQTRVALGQGDGAFAFQASIAAPPAAVPAGGSVPELVVGDFNGDGAADLAWHAFVERAKHTSVALSNRDGLFTFTAPDISPPRWGGEWRAYVADVDGDERDDLVFNALGQENLTRILRSNGDGTFSEVHGAIHVAQGWHGYAAYLGDVDGDGRPDFIWNDAPGGMNRIYVARSLAVLELLPWQDYPRASATGAATEQPHWAGFTVHAVDSDGDGRTDVVWIATDRDSVVIHRALGQTSAQFRFPDPQTIPRPPSAGSLGTAMGDFNADNRADLLLYELDGQANRFWIALGASTGRVTFAGGANQRPPWGAGGDGSASHAADLVIVDADGDGRSDIIWSERGGAHRIYVALARPGASVTRPNMTR